VREQPLVLEPVTRDPFIDEPRRRHRATRRVITPQCGLVRASLLRVADPEDWR
jgi:hypothetical protein